MRGTVMARTRAEIWLAAAWLAAVGLPQRLATAHDDTVVTPANASPSRQPTGSSADRDQRRAGSFVVTLLNGDRLTGRMLSLDAERLQFRPDLARDVEFDIRLPQLTRIEPSRSQQPVEPRGDRVYPRAGGVIHGTLTGVTARSLKLDAHLVGRVQLPLDTLAAFVKEGRDLPLRTAAPELFEVIVRFGPPEIAFAGPRRVIFWSTCADPDEEVKHMADALAAGLPKGWQLDAEAKHPQLGDLEADLLKAGVLVVPEMEDFNQGQKLPEPRQIGHVLRTFLERGGTVVLAGVGDAPAAYWKTAGLLSLTACPRANKANFQFAKDTPLAAGVGASFAAVNATHEYLTDDRQLEPVAVRDGGGAAVLVKRFGRGSLVLLGMDYYATSAEVNRVLVNAVTLQRSGP